MCVRSLLFFSMFLTLASCKEKMPSYHAEEYQEIKYEDLPEDIKVPTKIWELVEFKSASPDAADAHGGGHGGGRAASASSKNLVFSDLQIFLVEKNPGVVAGEAVKISLPKGGGTVDLSRFISNKQGTFYVGFEFPEFADVEAKKVIFISNTKKRRIGNQVFGAGCNQILDITDRFMQEMKGEGLKVNTTQERYVSVMGGTFLFAAQKGSDVFLAQVTFTNPQQAALFCGAP
ncbi:MAG: hypothetical protein HUU57_06910 [Bdellovibrio sp.]|nr:hypothetical protein [Bdellovibrio sp.]